MGFKHHTVEFAIPFQEIARNETQQLHCENLCARMLAQPLFDAGVIAVGLTKKAFYPAGGSSGRRTTHSIILVLQGELNVKLGRMRAIQRPGMLSFCPAGERYTRNNHTDSTWWIYFELQDLPVWAPLKNKGAYLRRCEWTDHMLILVSRLMEARREQTVAARLNATEDAHYLTELLRRELRVAVSPKPNKRMLAVQRLAVEIHSAPQKEWTVAAMSEKANLPPRSLSRLFKSELGMGPMDLVIKNRLNLASNLLMSTDYTIETIARELGYKSVYSFSNLFQRHVGLRPGQFRKKIHAEQSAMATTDL